MIKGGDYTGFMVEKDRLEDTNKGNKKNGEKFFGITPSFLFKWAFRFYIFKVFFDAYQEEKDKENKKPQKSENAVSPLETPTAKKLLSSIGKENFVTETSLKERLSDVIGIDEFREELEEIIEYLKNPKKYSELGAVVPKGILLAGPPGTGKTLIGRALSGEAGCSFLYCSGSDVDGKYRGSGKDKITSLFEQAKKSAPCIIFMDEIDSFASNRSHMNTRRHSVDQLLTELDGFSKNKDIIFIGATNYESSLDKAFMRSGRIDKVIRIPLPDVKGREKLLQYYIKKIKSQKVDVEKLARRIIGYSGADIKNYVNTAILHAVKKDKTMASEEDFDYAYDQMQMGIFKKHNLLSLERKREIAIKHIGQALVSYYTEGANKFYKVSILPNGDSFGQLSLLPPANELSTSRKNIEAQMDISTAGRAAEELFIGPERLTNSCSKSLAQATNLAYYYVGEMGMKNDTLFVNSEYKDLSEGYKKKTDDLVQSILTESLQRSKKLLQKHQGKLESLVKNLLTKETMTYEEFEKIIKSS